MQITAKIAAALNTRHFITAEELSKSYSEKAVKQELIRYGMAHENQVVCRVVSRNKESHSITTGFMRMRDVLDLASANKFEMLQMVPFGCFDESCSIDRIAEYAGENIIEKTGSLIRKAVKPRVTMKGAKTQGVVKKSSQATINLNKQKDKKNEPSRVQKEQVLKTKSVNVQTKKQVDLKTGPLEIKKTQKQAEKVQQKSKKQLQMSDSSDNQQKILARFNIQPTNLNNDKIEQETKDQKLNKQVEKKIEDIDIDEDDAYELLLKKQQEKANNKPENKCTNLLSKIEKKTTEKLEIKPKPVEKPKTAAQTQQKKSGQATLFSFMNKKMAS